MLGTELGPSARAASALNLPAIFPAHRSFLIGLEVTSFWMQTSQVQRLKPWMGTGLPTCTAECSPRISVKKKKRGKYLFQRTWPCQFFYEVTDVRHLWFQAILTGRMGQPRALLGSGWDPPIGAWACTGSAYSTVSWLPTKAWTLLNCRRESYGVDRGDHWREGKCLLRERLDCASDRSMYKTRLLHS